MRSSCARRVSGWTRRNELADVPVFAVSPPLADQANEVDNDQLAGGWPSFPASRP